MAGLYLNFDVLNSDIVKELTEKVNALIHEIEKNNYVPSPELMASESLKYTTEYKELEQFIEKRLEM